MPAAWLFPEHSCIVAKRFQLVDDNLPKVRMRRIDQTVVLARSKCRRDEQQTMFTFACEFIAEAGQFRRSGRVAPSGREIRSRERLWFQIAGDFGDG